MSEITINIPRSTRRAKVALSDEYNLEEFTGNSQDMQSFIRDYKIRKRSNALFAQRKRELAKKVIFTEKFVISNSNQPVNISLKKVAEPALTISEAKIEIQNAYDKGFGDGQDAASIAYQNEVKKYNEWITEFDKITMDLKNEYSRNIHILEQSVIPSAVMIAKHIIGREITNGSDIVIEQVKKAIRLTDEESVMKIAINPIDFDVLNSVKRTLAGDKSVADRIEITSDENISRGGCIVFTNAGVIDATIESQLLKVQQNLIDM
jgi:flagellar biosynthesis/type III secretory pathway protein FliH